MKICVNWRGRKQGKAFHSFHFQCVSRVPAEWERGGGTTECDDNDRDDAEEVDSLRNSCSNRRTPWAQPPMAQSLGKVATICSKNCHASSYTCRSMAENAVNEVRTALMREWNVMQWLANPYLNAEKEAPYLERYGNINDEWTQRTVEAKHRKMPNKPKIRQIASGEVEKRRANVGNLLHAHRTVEDELKNLERRNRWD
ncbi:hypothetical protein niasHT_000924 [Heterodera trifolii]|uniref:Uncharacterized protein n=1 Tax=Heterodera trifolii TaxID=157864 RepID=A0ABD2LRL4_9BILA